MRQFAYPVKLTSDERDGGRRDVSRFPEAITQGDTIDAAVAEAADALDEAIAARIDDQREILEPSAAKRGERRRVCRHRWR